ncbi:disease resistance protein Roq1-like isoform X4 [Arachis stenosperma]|uniref:disease resistance protein Roq1-like isoform X4 n=1 Tax=Arachis stenosperma TaxID=217475 RepID=UPI0025AC3038|nr:disease resistance protein Roq1-like isoform X4 [Arachis stenosperma]
MKSLLIALLSASQIAPARPSSPHRSKLCAWLSLCSSSLSMSSRLLCLTTSSLSPLLFRSHSVNIVSSFIPRCLSAHRYTSSNFKHMASAFSSTSIPLPPPPPPPRSCTYHVFLSFRGKDIRTGFIGHLYAALNRKGITTYKDDKNLRKGHVISKELLKAIEESMFAVIVFSPDYASSSWCLDELQKIIECKNQLGLQMLAVFYGVEPSDVRHQRRTFEEAFKKHEERHDSEKVKRWRDALTQVAAHSAWTSKIYEDEAVLVENIAQHIFEILIPKLPSSMKNLVGINSRVEQVITQIGLGLNDVRYIGIWGMGGIGKTTIARAVFETIRFRFEVTCFLADVRENCEKKDITHMQKQLLDQMNISSNAVYNKYDGRTIIQNSLRLKKVLLVLDDVNHEKQLEDLAGEQDWFGPGSRIIITTRDVEALKGPEVHETYNVEGSLITINKYDQLGMHDLLEEMGKQIVIKESPNDASKHSRLWCLEDVEFVLTQKKKTKATHGIVVSKWWYSKTEVIQRDLSFSKMCQLKLLILDGVEAPILCDIPCTLKVFRWRYCPLETLPLTDHQRYELVEINLSGSKIVKLWDGKKVLEKLEHLDLSGCQQLKQTPDLSGAPNLKKLNLWGCKKLDYIHPSLTHHKRLVELNLRGCRSLETLGDKLEMSSLERLDLYSCSSLKRLPEFGECMKQLSILNLTLTGIEELPPTLGNLAGVSELDLTGCSKITGLLLSLSLGCFVGLKKLVLCSLPQKTDYDDSDSSSREESTLSYDIAHLASLMDLVLSRNSFLRVPISIHQLPRLTRLKLSFCWELEVLPELPSSLRELDAQGCYSLDASNVDDVISKACCGFAESASQDREDFLQMLITGEEIPAWFEHQEQDNGVSLSFPLNCPSTEMVALALCFLVIQDIQGLQPSVICNGKEFINTSLEVWDSSDNLFIVCVNSYYFSKLLCQQNRFQMLFPDRDYLLIQVKRSGARWLFKQDIQDFKKRKYETGKRKATLEDLN